MCRARRKLLPHVAFDSGEVAPSGDVGAFLPGQRAFFFTQRAFCSLQRANFSGIAPFSLERLSFRSAVAAPGDTRGAQCVVNAVNCYVGGAFCSVAQQSSHPIRAFCSAIGAFCYLPGAQSFLRGEKSYVAENPLTRVGARCGRLPFPRIRLRDPRCLLPFPRN